MTRYLYGFGFETPRQRMLNLQHGWDDEDSALIIIRAENTDAAYAWGREVAEASVRRLFERAHAQELPSWKELKYADSIEEAPADVDAPEVEVDEMPPIDWLGAPER
ncbi:MAG: hypothetical protein ACYC7A_13750 [Thermoanaerobaculia bacterium]